MLKVVRDDWAIEISSHEQWANMLLLLQDYGWKPEQHYNSYLTDIKVSDEDAFNIIQAGRKIQDKAMKSPLEFYPTKVDMGIFAEFIQFCEEGCFSIQTTKENAWDSSIEDERNKLIEKAISDKFDIYTNRVVELMKSITDKMSGEDSPLNNAWEEYASQVQGEHSAFFYVYEEQIYLFCRSILGEMTLDEIKLLWAGRDPNFNDYPEGFDGFVGIDQMKDDLEEELFRLVTDIAYDEELDTDN